MTVLEHTDSRSRLLFLEEWYRLWLLTGRPVPFTLRSTTT